MKKYRIIALILSLLCCFTAGCNSDIKTETQPATQVKKEKNIEYLYDENIRTITISGSGKITEYDFIDVATDLVITGDITEINDNSFSSSSFYNVTIGGAVEKIGVNAFLGCEGLQEVEFSENLKIIKEAAFFGCRNLSKVTIPEGVETVGVHAFASCDLEEITIPESVTSIGREAVGFYVDPDNWYSKPVENFTIKGYKGSTAEKYATENGFNFVALDE